MRRGNLSGERGDSSIKMGEKRACAINRSKRRNSKRGPINQGKPNPRLRWVARLPRFPLANETMRRPLFSLHRRFAFFAYVQRVRRCYCLLCLIIRRKQSNYAPLTYIVLAWFSRDRTRVTSHPCK